VSADVSADDENPYEVSMCHIYKYLYTFKIIHLHASICIYSSIWAPTTQVRTRCQFSVYINTSIYIIIPLHIYIYIYIHIYIFICIAQSERRRRNSVRGVNFFIHTHFSLCILIYEHIYIHLLQSERRRWKSTWGVDFLHIYMHLDI